MQLQWLLNASTGSYIARLSGNERIIRIGTSGKYIYSAEYWGDYSSKYPIKTGACKTLKKSIELLHKIRYYEVTQ